MIGKPAAAPYAKELVAALRHHEDSIVRQHAAGALGQIGTAREELGVVH